LRKESKNVAQIQNYLIQGKKSEKSGCFEKAIECYSKALEEMDDCLLKYKRGCLYEKIGDRGKAAEDFKDFLITDKRHGHGGTSFFSVMDGLIEGVSIANQRLNAKKTLTQVTFEKILGPSVPFDFYYHNKKLFDWGQVQILLPSDENSLLENNPQEVAFRKGVKCFLQGKHEKAIKYFDDAIIMNSEDAKSYLFRSMVHALQSQHVVHALPIRKNRIIGSSDNSKELSWSRFESDLKQAMTLSKNNEIVKRACLRTKYWLVDYERELANQYANQPTPAARLLGFIGTLTGIILGITFIGQGLASFFMSSLPDFMPISSPIFLGCGILALIGGFSINKGKKLRGAFLITVAILIVLTFFIST